MKPEYKPKTELQKLGYLVEKCGEAIQAIGKSIRWGLDSVNPELPEEEQETNRAWILREIKDLKMAIEYVEKEIDD